MRSKICVHSPWKAEEESSFLPPPPHSLSSLSSLTLMKSNVQKERNEEGEPRSSNTKALLPQLSAFPISSFLREIPSCLAGCYATTRSHPTHGGFGFDFEEKEREKERTFSRFCVLELLTFPGGGVRGMKALAQAHLRSLSFGQQHSLLPMKADFRALRPKRKLTVEHLVRFGVFLQSDQMSSACCKYLQTRLPK